MSFSQIFSRGLEAALRTPLGIIGYFCVLGLQQATIPISSAFLPAMFEQQPGAPPSPETLTFVGIGCFTCTWSLVMIFAGPFVAGGTLGQLRDRLSALEKPVGRFSDYGSQFYLRALVVMLVFIGVMTGLYFVNAIVGGLITASQDVGTKMDYAEFQKLARHPANIASGIITGVIFTAVSVVFHLAFAIVGSDNRSALGALGEALRFCRVHSVDAFKLFIVYLTFNAISWPLYASGALFSVRSIPVLVLLGFILAIWISFLVVLSLGLATSLYLARRSLVSATGVASTD